MADNQQQDLFADAYAEAARRGLIPADLKSAAQAEAEKRGLVSKASAVDSAFSGFDDVIRSIARGATFGYADEIAAVMNSATRGGSYEENLAKEQARTAEVSPVTRVVGEITGAIGGTVATAPARAAAVAATGLSRVPGLVRAAAGGAAGGALYGSEEAGPGNRLSATTAEGAAIGAVAGPVGMAVARGVGRAVQAVSSPVKAAIADIQRALTRDEITPEHAQQLAQALGADRPAATLADVGGENVRGLMERVAQTPGAGRTQVVPFLTARQQEQTDRIANDLSQLTGTKQSAFNAINQTMQERSTQGKPLYDAAMNFNARADADVAKAWAEETSSGWGASILKSGTLRKNLQSEYGTKDIADAPLMVTIDAWKKVADDMGGAAVRAGNKNTARTISETRDAVLDVVKDKNKAYAQALSAWAGKSKYLDSIENGKGILSNKLSAEQLKADFDKLGTSEQEAFRIGAVSSIVSKMRADPAKLGDMTKYLRSPEVRDKVAAIMPSKAAADAWKRRLDFEVGSSELVGQSLRNSATARRQAEMNDAKGIVGDLVMHAFTGAGSTSLAMRLLSGGRALVRDTMRSRADKEIAKMLTRPLARPLPSPPSGQ